MINYNKYSNLSLCGSGTQGVINFWTEVMIPHDSGNRYRELQRMLGIVANAVNIIRTFQVTQGLATGAENTWTVLDEKMSGL